MEAPGFFNKLFGKGKRWLVIAILANLCLALAVIIRSTPTPPTYTSGSASLEARQIRAMVEGMKQELREFLADGGTVVEYGKELVCRQEQELGYFNRAQNELKAARELGKPESAVIELWKMRNSKLRRMGIKLVPLPE